MNQQVAVGFFYGCINEMHGLSTAWAELHVFLVQMHKAPFGPSCVGMMVNNLGLIFLPLMPPGRFFEMSSTYFR